MKLQGFEVELDGERKICHDTAAVQQQLTGLLTPLETATDGHRQLGENTQVIEGEVAKSRSRAPRKRGSGAKPAEPGTVIEFRHDAAKYGNPVQSWNTAEKCIWLLYVLKNITDTKKVFDPQLSATFNNYFKGSGKIYPPRVSRDLARVKVANPSPIGEDKGLWYLTDEGDRQAQELIRNVMAPASS